MSAASLYAFLIPYEGFWMFLRRLSEAIAEQNWFVVVIELLVVIVGIFLGLQVDDWKEARNDKTDEQIFLQRLHEDLLLADELSARVRERRLGRLQSIMDASDVLFSRVDRTDLTEEECTAISSSSFFNINASGLSSYEELAGTGRINIIRAPEIRTALVELQQSRAALSAMVALQTSSDAFVYLPFRFPELIQATSYFDTDIGEIRSRHRCDLTAMRANQQFLNGFSANADGYDAYVRDGLKPWSIQFDRVHKLVDQALGIRH